MRRQKFRRSRLPPSSRVAKTAYLTLILGALSIAGGCRRERTEAVTLLNVSYDPTRELYAEYNALFSAHWQKKGRGAVVVNQSHGGSAKQARSVIDGLEADVVTLALEHDVSKISAHGLIDPKWKTRLPSNSAPYTSVIVLLVRKGNPKQIRDWDDLTRAGVEVITPNPKTGGGARLNYLAAWAYAQKKFAGDENAVRKFVAQVYKNVKVLDAGARGSATTFAERGIGDVLIAWESEAQMLLGSVGEGQFEVILPSISILAEPSVAVVDAHATKHGTRELATAYLEHLFSSEAQQLIAKHHFRPRDPSTLEQHRGEFANLPLVTVDDLGGWELVQGKHFAEGGIYDELMAQ